MMAFTPDRFADLSRMSYEKGIYTFSDFLTMAEQSDLIGMGRELYCKYELFGGTDTAERRMARFGDKEELGYTVPFPVCAIEIKPLQAKFAEDLTHRDFLGSIMNLGVDRSKFGDIIVNDKTHWAYVFTEEDIAEYICRELTRVRHTSVASSVCDHIEEIPAPDMKSLSIQVKSERIDGVTAHTYSLSRSQAAELFLQKKIFVNGRLMENESHILAAGDIVSVRGYGRYTYMGITGKSKKNNLYCEVLVY